MQFVGLLLIVNSLIGAAWWIASGRPQMVVIPICVAALSAGVFLIIHERTAAVDGKIAPTVSSTGFDELVQQTAAAKAVLADLEDQTAAADWHLKQLDEHIHAMQILPDGRTRVGNTVTGQAVILIPKLEALQKVSAERPAEAHPLAKECVSIYEATREQMKGVILTGGDLGPETVAWLYVTASTAAQRIGEHEEALTWARAAVALRPSAERQFLLVTALINKNLQSEANALVLQQLKAGGTEVVKFRQLLDQYKIPYKRPD
jgi:hypothetical protein